ncbi:MAG: TniB family NTP-binding protein [Rhodobacteraceae bacterium]|nr:TniB family NTP-binding protein [Paracoccaceae bacterium]
MTSLASPSAQTTPHAIAAVMGKYITLERDRAFVAKLDRLLMRDEAGGFTGRPVTFTSTGETRGIALTGTAGSGKTSLVHRALSKHPALQPSEAAQMPLVAVSVPNPATIKSLGMEILKATGYSEIHSDRPAWKIWADVDTRLALLGTVVLWIDEAHDIFAGKSKTDAPEILNHLKRRMQGTGAVIVVLSGLEILWDDLCKDSQVKRRFARFDLPPVSTAADRKVLAKVLGNFCDTAALDRPEQGDLVERLAYAGQQRFGLCVEQMIAAIEVALMRGASRLTIEHFAEAYFEREGCPVAENVFMAPRWSSINLRPSAK